MKMKYPRSIVILGRKFTIEFMDNKRIAEITQSNSNPVGAMNFKRREILISNTLNEEDTLVTFMHECHHAISYIIGKNQITNWDLFELEAESYANGFYGVFKQLKKGR